VLEKEIERRIKEGKNTSPVRTLAVLRRRQGALPQLVPILILGRDSGLFQQIRGFPQNRSSGAAIQPQHGPAAQFFLPGLRQLPANLGATAII
jgi:hypothetical protein